MKSWERLLTIVGIIIAVGAAAQGAFVLPYRVEQGEKAHAQLVSDFNAEKIKSAENRESMIRIEERLKSIQQVIESMDRRQRRDTTQTQMAN